MSQRILIIDHYDSFVYNLARYVEECGGHSIVYRCDQITLPEILEENPLGIILSPGPCTPNESGISLSIVETFAKQMPMLGVCLGHQVIAQAFGASIERALRPLHGQAASIIHSGSSFFEDLSPVIEVGRYHSLIVSPHDFPRSLQVTARSEEGEIMAFEHRTLPIYGMQFHLESIMTPDGRDMLRWFMQRCRD